MPIATQSRSCRSAGRFRRRKRWSGNRSNYELVLPEDSFGNAFSRSTAMSRTNRIIVSFCLVLISTSALAQSGVVDSTQNANQLAILHWYTANQTTSFTTGKTPIAFVYDGASMWVVNFGDNTVSKMRATDGAVLGTFAVGKSPWAVTYDGANIWVTNRGDATVSKLRGSDGAALGTFPVTGSSPTGIAFDGANIWVANSDSNDVTKLRASDGAILGTFTVGGHPLVPEAPLGVAIDGANVWVTNFGDNSVTKLRA